MFIRIQSGWINLTQIVEWKPTGASPSILYLSNDRTITISEESDIKAIEKALEAHEWHPTQED